MKSGVQIPAHFQVEGAKKALDIAIDIQTSCHSARDGQMQREHLVSAT
jgi:hypothetical protein